MKKIGRIIGTGLLVLILTACAGGRIEKVETPSGMKIQRGRNYKEVIEDFQDKGFTNIRTEPIEDLLIGWVARHGEVEEISVGGDSDYDAGVWVPADTEVVIRYHTYITGRQTEEDSAESAPVQEGSGSTGSGVVETDSGSGGRGSADNKDNKNEGSGAGSAESESESSGTGSVESQ